MELILTTVGTSLITNYIDDNPASNLKNKWNQIKDKAYSESDWNNLYDDFIEPFIEPITQWEQADSAEIKTLKLLIEKFGKVSTYLVTSDTIAGVLAGALLKDILSKRGILIQGEPKRIDKFDVLSKDKTKIKQGFDQYIKYLVNDIYVNGYNISGGYKAIIPITTLIASYKKLPLFYNFEASEVLIEIPPFPYDWDLDRFSVFEDFLKKVEEGIDTNSSDYKTLISNLKPTQKELLNSIILIDSDGIITESEIGTIYRQAYKANREVELVKTDLLPDNKQFKVAGTHHGNDKLEAFWKKICQSPYVMTCINSIDSNSKMRKMIGKIKNINQVELYLHWEERGPAMLIETTGRNLKETEKIAEILTKEYDR